MHKTTKWLIVSTVFFAFMTAGLTATTLYYAKKSHKAVRNAPAPKKEVLLDSLPYVPHGRNASPAIAPGKVYSEMAIEDFSIAGNMITLHCSEMPDVDAAKEYISVDPAPKGGLVFSAGVVYDYWRRCDRHVLKITGD